MLAVRTKKKHVDLIVDFIHKLSLKIEERLFKLINGDVCERSRNLEDFNCWCILAALVAYSMTGSLPSE